MKALFAWARKNRKGQAVVEMAITLPILLLILCGIIDFGWIITNQNTIDYSARTGTRYAITNAVGQDASLNIRNYTLALVPDRMKDTMSVSVTFTNPQNPRLGDVIVEVSGDVEILTPIAGLFTKGQRMNLRSSCRMKVE